MMDCCNYICILSEFSVTESSVTSVTLGTDPDEKLTGSKLHLSNATYSMKPKQLQCLGTLPQSYKAFAVLTTVLATVSLGCYSVMYASCCSTLHIYKIDTGRPWDPRPIPEHTERAEQLQDPRPTNTRHTRHTRHTLLSDVGRDAFWHVEGIYWRILAGSQRHRGGTDNVALHDLFQKGHKPTGQELHSVGVNLERHYALAVQGRQRVLPKFDLHNWGSSD